ncbi:DUF4041 domain-containing protein [Pelagibius marinus]|uniref:DUF4041 domain-containing protein n=1 Tax=Pelagibius marinus TaxID=2762760 RepID=UPI0029CA0F2E|nr:DUF4041 domain-containing protein [Pelagibius marinus]
MLDPGSASNELTAIANTYVIAILLWMLLPLVLFPLWIWARIRLRKYAPIASVESEVERLNREADNTRRDIEEVRSTYKEKHQLLRKLEQQVAVYDERLSFAELGVYEPHFDFGDSEVYKKKIKEARERQKAMVSAKTATSCPTNWAVDGSKSRGQTMINRQTRLTMRAFNNECEAAIANTRWNNVVAMERRILNAAKQINNANSSMDLVINEDYVLLKLAELHLTHEHREQLKIEKEERAERARAEREEKKLLAEAHAAEREEERFQELLEKARKEAGVDGSRIAELEAALAEAHAKTERARAMAEMTKSGYVYIISNIGSFGEDVVKIGLTRRLEPDDRVRELGDASVPFGFDTHAMIYSEEAPALESALHQEFSDRRVNAANMRKEFFRVSLQQIEDAVTRLAPNASFFKDREAQEWHETLARRKQRLTDMQTVSDEFPEEI